MPEVLHRAMRTAIARKGVAVIVLPGDVSMLDIEGEVPAVRRPHTRTPPARRGGAGAGGRTHQPVGAGDDPGGRRNGRGARRVVALADRLAAPIVHAYRGKEHMEWDNPFDVGMTGLIGFSSAIMP